MPALWDRIVHCLKEITHQACTKYFPEAEYAILNPVIALSCVFWYTGDKLRRTPPKQIDFGETIPLRSAVSLNPA
jgi:hypothetical protein